MPGQNIQVARAKLLQDAWGGVLVTPLQGEKKKDGSGDIAIPYQFSWNAISDLVVNLGSYWSQTPAALLKPFVAHTLPLPVVVIWYALIG